MIGLTRCGQVHIGASQVPWMPTLICEGESCRARDVAPTAQPIFETRRRKALPTAMCLILQSPRRNVGFVDNNSYLSWSDTYAFRRRFTSAVRERIRCRPASAEEFDFRSPLLPTAKCLSTFTTCCWLPSSIPTMWCLTSRESLEVLAADSVGR